MTKLTEQEVLAIQRAGKLETSQLQQTILQATQDMPQASMSPSQQQQKTQSKFTFLNIFRPLMSFNRTSVLVASVVCVVLAAPYLTPNLLNRAATKTTPMASTNYPVIDSTEAIDFSIANDQSGRVKLTQELEWQELMLMSDELVFASF